MPTSSEIKRALREAGIEIYRTRGSIVHIAERVRENLIMDAGVRIDESLRVTFYVRAERRDFPGEEDDRLFARARNLASSALERGFIEGRAFVTELPDPGDPTETLDRWFQVQFDKAVSSIDLAIEEIRFACTLDKQARR